MCGITGMYSVSSEKEINRNLFDQALQCIQHRGPDHHSTYFHRGVALGHVRLSVIDTSAEAHQPFFSADGKKVLVFNGEIFNYKEIKSRLEEKGCSFRTRSDTEVLLHLLDLKGIDGLHEINGFFAFAYYDLEKEKLLIARDRFGEKPLFYSYDEAQSTICFASELSPLLKLSSRKTTNKLALSLLLQLTYIPSPYTIVEGVNKLTPGGYLSFDKNGFELKQWYTLPSKMTLSGADLPGLTKRVEQLLMQAVQRRMVSDVPVAGFLSGGIDSSIVSSLAHEINPSYETFSLGFDGNTMVDETSDAVFAAKQFGIRHHVVKLSEQQLLENIADLWTKADEPFGDSSAIALYSLCKTIKGKYKVILSGDGADEVFAGYNKHYGLYKSDQGGLGNALIRQFGFMHTFFPKARHSGWGNKGRHLQKMYELLSAKGFDRYWYTVGFNASQASALMLNPMSIQDFKNSICEHNPFQDFNRYLYYDLKLVLPGDMLYKVDRASMLNGIEIRSPFLDHELIEFAFSVPGQYKIHNGSKKFLLKKAFENRLPKQLINKPKHGFEVPLTNWLRGPLKAKVDEFLNAELITDQGLFSWNKVNELKQKLNSASPGDSASTVWSLLNFQVTWLKHLNA